MRVHIASNAALCLLPDPVQPFDGSIYEQTQIFKLEEDASLCLLDWVTQGRSGSGENWSFVRWVGRNEIWTAADGAGTKERLWYAMRSFLDGRQKQAELKNLRDTMYGMGIFGTLILRGPLLKSLGDFFLAEFAALPRLGARGSTDDESKPRSEGEPSQLERWRSDRLGMEKRGWKLLWSAANVRGCVVVKFGARCGGRATMAWVDARTRGQHHGTLWRASVDVCSVIMR